VTELVMITDSDLPEDGILEEILERDGFRVRRESCRTEEEVIAAAGDAVGLIVQWARIGEAVFTALPRLRAVSRLGIGVDMVNTEAATRHGVAVSNTPDYCVDEVALHALALSLALLRGVVGHDTAVRAGRWEPVAGYPGARRPGQTTIGSLGFGRIGRRVVAGAVAMGFDVIVCDAVPQETAIRAAGARAVRFDELLAESDLLTLHAPLTPETREIMDAHAISQMKPGAFLVNTTRGDLIDEAALADALERGHLAGAALDVFTAEPLPPGSPLRHARGMVLTPHSAWYSPEALRQLPRHAALNMSQLLAGDPAPGLLNPEFSRHRRPEQLDAL
jgi:D-3-phosphoglycerate dehydrogenase